ncbi:MAG: UDP-N-acetylglucosamine diphosphorylase/glucosamine-1-phosphate N-acetyltransferase [Acidobacteria bacterium]|nr:MAG: UDP-N-acetylglucosamine diphosphorylase/glucosamine-1-phosphate N-acetyltransferase [Acidobacteriota bacterium]
MSNPRFAIAILAAGKGTRLKSKLPKVLHRIAGRPLLSHVVHAASTIVAPSDIFCIIGHEADRVRAEIAPLGTEFIEQREQNGTGHALMQCREALAAYDHVLVLSGDVPLMRPETIASVRDFHTARGAAMTILTAEPPDPFGYGRIVRRTVHGVSSDQVEAIVEQKQLTPEQEDIGEINSGIYAFDVRELFARIDQLSTDNPHGEFYLTQIAGILQRDGKHVLALRTPNASEVLGVNTRRELAHLDSILRERKTRELMDNGVTIFKPETVLIDAGVSIGADTVIEPFVQLLGETSIGEDCLIRSYSVLTNTQVADGVRVNQGTIAEESCVERGAIIGPYARLRQGSEIGPEAHVGNFVETKKTKLARGAKANHLTYLGDAEIGERANIGAGTITCNYDGVNKHKTIIGARAFIGSDTTLVAPVRVGDGAYVGAASCITKDIPDDSLGLTRPQLVIREGWALEKRAKLEAAKEKK